MSGEAKYTEDEYNAVMSEQLMQSLDINALAEAYGQICTGSDSSTLNLTDFICGLIRFGINDLSNKQMESIFNAMHKSSNHDHNIACIEQHDFIEFLTTSPHEAQSTEHIELQRLLLTELHDLLQGSKRAQYPSSHRYDGALTASNFIEFAYIPTTTHSQICTKYEHEIARLKQQLKEVLDTLKQTVASNAQHIGEHQQVIAQLRYSLLQQQEEEEAQEILIQSSLEPTTDYNPLEWGVEDVADWLKMVKLSHYTHAFKVYQVNGPKLLNEVSNWDKHRFLNELNFESPEEVDHFLNKVSILQQTAPQIYDPHEVQASPTPSTPSALSVYAPPERRKSQSLGEEEEEEKEDEEEDDPNLHILIDSYMLDDESEHAIIPLQETESVTQHTFVPPHSVQQELDALKQQQNAEIVKLKAQIERIEKSKAESLVAASMEIDRLRNMIKMLQCKCVNT